ncbi:MAG: hypothetical protein ACKPB3_03845, partial [Bacteroidota bacterium]
DSTPFSLAWLSPIRQIKNVTFVLQYLQHLTSKGLKETIFNVRKCRNNNTRNTNNHVGLP